MQNTTPQRSRVILLVGIALLFMLRSFAEETEGQKYSIVGIR